MLPNRIVDSIGRDLAALHFSEHHLIWIDAPAIRKGREWMMLLSVSTSCVTLELRKTYRCLVEGDILGLAHFS